MRNTVRPRLRTYQLQSIGWKRSVSKFQRVFENRIEAGSARIPLQVIRQLLEQKVFEPLHLVRTADHVPQPSGPRVDPAANLISRLLPDSSEDSRIVLRFSCRSILFILLLSRFTAEYCNRS